MDFKGKYGPWAIVAGASEGTGRAFARQLAGQGLNCILIARREAPLLELSRELTDAHGVECVVASIDLSRPSAFDEVQAAVGEREVGLYISNAGADPNGAHFLDRGADVWLELVSRNLVTTLRCCHHFGGIMRQRRRGGLLLVGSGAGFGGAPFMATYAGVKAFDLGFAESLWAELRPHDVDVLCLVLSTTDTPALHKLMNEKESTTPTRLASPQAVAEAGLARLGRGPVYCPWGPARGLRAAARRLRVSATARMSASFFAGRAA